MTEVATETEVTETTGTKEVTAPIGLVNDKGEFSEKFLEHFDEGDRPTLERFAKTGLKSMGKSYADLQRQFRSPDDYVKMPKDDSSDEEKAAFHKRRGVPDTADAAGYKYEMPEGLPECITSDDEMALYYQMAKDANLTSGQFKKMADGHFANIIKVIADADAKAEELNNQAYDAANMKLNKVFGSGKAKEQRILRANAVMRHYMGEEAVASLKAENNPLMTMFIDRIAQDMAPARIEGIIKGGSASISTNADIDKKMNELRDTEGYYDNSHKDHRKLMEQRKQLSLQRTA